LTVFCVKISSFCYLFASECYSLLQVFIAKYTPLLYLCLRCGMYVIDIYPNWYLRTEQNIKSNRTQEKRQNIIYLFESSGISFVIVINMEEGPHSTVAAVSSNISGIIASFTMGIQYLPQLWLTWRLKVHWFSCLPSPFFLWFD
jgi:hypothetical protein